MLHTHDSTNYFKHLLALTLALVGLTGWPNVPIDSASRRSPQDQADEAHASNLAGQPAAASKLTSPDEATQSRVNEAYGKLPLSFEANQGQTDQQVKFLARGSGYGLFLTSQEAILALSQPAGGTTARGSVAAHRAVEARSAKPSQAVLRMKLLGANSTPPIAGQDELPGKSHYLIGNNPKKWRTNIPCYGKVKYEGVYPGVDLLYYGNQGQLEYDFVVSAGADPRGIKLLFAGAQDVRIGHNGELVLGAGGAEIRQLKPVIYQEVDGVRKEIAGGYRIEGKHQVSFDVGRYDVSRVLVIDPVLVYSTYLGGIPGDVGRGIAVDKEGHAYVTGENGSDDFPTTPGAFQTTDPGPGSGNAFVTKLNHSGSALVYSTYLGGSGFDTGYDIEVDKEGHAYVTGETSSPDFPTTPGAFQTTNPGADAGISDVFVTKLNRSGSALVYSTYLGGSDYDYGYGISVDEEGRAYMTGTTFSPDFPTTSGAFQTTDPATMNANAFVTKLNRSGSALAYSTYLGRVDDVGIAIAVDEEGHAYVTGQTYSPNFPTTPGAFQTTAPIDANAFVTKLNRSGSALAYSTYLGGSDQDFGVAIAVDDEGRAYVTGFTLSDDFPTTPGAFQTTKPGAAGISDAFVTKLNRSGSALAYSTYLGGSDQDDFGGAIAVDEEGHAYVTGTTRSTDFPTTAGAFPPATNPVVNDNAFVTKLNRSGSALVYSTYLGGSDYDFGYGIAVGKKGHVYVTGDTSSGDFPTSPGAFQTTKAGFFNAFVAKIGDNDDDD